MNQFEVGDLAMATLNQRELDRAALELEREALRAEARQAGSAAGQRPGAGRFRHMGRSIVRFTGTFG
jgi:hypothetical protein